MAWQWMLILLVAAWTPSSQQASTPESDSYVAAVVELSPVQNSNGPLTLLLNSRKYVEFIKQASQGGADIVVFPEDGLTTIHMPKNKAALDSWVSVIPSPNENYTPCINTSISVSDTLRTLSCAARENNIYVVINIAERYISCENANCNRIKTIYYNSNVVFDRTGKIIARYRKVNLFGEKQFDVTDIPEVVTFDTDFGVKFGTFICFDILFWTPALNLTRELGVTDIVYSAAWFSEVPFLTSVQTQAGWAYSENVNLLAAGYNYPAQGSTGSGIYLGRQGVASAIFLNSARDQLLISRVPKMRKDRAVNQGGEPQRYMDLSRGPVAPAAPATRAQVNEDGIVHLLHDHIDRFTSQLIEKVTDIRLCQNGFCCEFKVETSTVDPRTKYRAVVFSGHRFYGMDVRAAVHACGLIQCANESVSSCGSVMKSSTTFTKVEITGTIDNYKNILVFPTVLNSTMLPVTNWSYETHLHDNHAHVSFLLDVPTKDIVTLGLYGRVFPEDPIGNAASTVVANTLLMALIVVVLCRF